MDEPKDIEAQSLPILDRLSRLTDLQTNSIIRLKEYRSALITAAVTGQIDVVTSAGSGTTDRRIDTIEAEANV